ncbi:MAG TPA: GRP family sugar transporter [Nitrosopumilaceae archaeon]|nr:GRP family sugar transporter [Nitrosopumilaceae archaeon]
MTDFGLLFAALAAISWGTFFVPVRKVGVTNVWQLQGATSFGVLLFAIPIGFFWGFEIQLSGLFSGIIWTVANLLALYSVKLIGLARTSPLLAGFSIITSFVWGAVFFGETFDSLVLALAAIGLLLGGLPLVSSGEKNPSIQKKGYFIAVASGLIGGSYIIPMQATQTLQSGFFSLSLSIFAIGIPLFFFARRFIKKETVAGLVSGILFNLGSLSVLVAVGIIGITIAYPISQTATLFAVSWGILYFKEIVQKRGILRVAGGAVIILCGAALLAIA